MSTMVERVARAVVENPPEERQEATDSGWRIIRNYERTARAAIEEMREPTEAMCLAAKIWSPSLRESYQQMIDAALSEQEQG